jgi:hypothetical protein
MVRCRVIPRLPDERPLLGPAILDRRYLVRNLQLPTLIRTCFPIFGARISYTIYLGSQIGILSFF